jgi:hypothetical protein
MSSKDIYLHHIETLDTYVNKHYVDKYLKFIDSRISKEGPLYLHHILPKALFPEFSDLKKSPWNGCSLTFREHKIAHMMLAKALPLTNMHCALYFFYIDTISNTSWYNDGISNIRLNKTISSENLNKGRISTGVWKNRTYVSKDGKNFQIYTHELEQYIANGYDHKLIKIKTIHVTNGKDNTAIPENKIQYFLEHNPDWKIGVTVKSEKRKIGKSKKYHKNNIEYLVPLDDIDFFEENGWIKGRSFNSISKFKNKSKQIHKNDKNKRVSLVDLESFLSDGWTLGIPPEHSKKSAMTQREYIRVYNKDTLKEHKIHPNDFNNEIHIIGRSPITIEKIKKNKLVGKKVGLISPTNDVIILNMKKNIVYLGMTPKIFKTPQLTHFFINEEYRTRLSKESLNLIGWQWFDPLMHPTIQETISYNDLILKLQDL